MPELRTIVTITEVTVTILGTLYFYKYRKSNLKYFLPLLYVMLIYEFANQHLMEHRRVYYLCANLMLILTMSYFMWLFRSYTKDALRRKIIKIFLVVYLLSCVASVIILGFDSGGYDEAHLLGAILTVLSIMYFAIDLFGGKDLYNLNKDLLLWVGAGYLVYFVSFPVIQAARLLFVRNEALFPNLQIIHVGIIVLMYGIISFGFIWSDKKLH